MKYVFVINPCAGQGKGLEQFEKDILEAASKTGVQAEIYYTKAVGDAQVYTRTIAQNLKEDEKLRVFACGGDGTVNEVVNGAMGFDNVEVGAFPIGTGNDYIRNYGTSKDFMNVENQILGQAIEADVIKYSGVIDGQEQARYCANMFNIGFDCNVVDKTAEIKKKPLVSGSMAYLLAVASVLIKKKGANLRITVDGKLVHRGPNLLCAIANGSYCGGGIYSSPQASTSDGVMDVNIILDVPRTKFIALFPKYQKGTHFEVNGIEKIIQAFPCKNAIIEPLNGTMRLCVDGEIYTVGTIKMEVVPKAIKFVVPKK